jgi:1-acyl-sn-glycerol-3-phosphate acyltransferase
MVRWMMAREYSFGILNWFWKRYKPILVDRNGKDAAAAKSAVACLKEGDILGVFPEGHINPGEELLPFEPGIAMIAKRANVTIVPVHLSGAPRNVNPMTSYIIPSHSRVIFGKPFQLSEEESHDRNRAMQKIRSKLQELIDQSNPI